MVSTFDSRVDGVSTSTALKAPCRVATTENITLSGLQTIDGVALAADDRVLVKNQTDTTKNGIYVVSSTTWQRAEDFDGNRDVVTGTRIYIASGSTYAGYEVTVTSANPIVIDTTSLTFTLLSVVNEAIAADIETVAGIASDVTTVAGLSDDVSTVAGISADVTAVAGISDDVQTVAGVADEFGDLASIATAAAGSATAAATSEDNAESYYNNIVAMGIAYTGDITSRIAADPVWDSFAYPDQPLLLPELTFARSTAGYTVNRKGLLESVAADAFRLYYDKDTFGLVGYVNEGSSTNLTGHSIKHASAGWSKVETGSATVTVTENYGTDPAGNTTATRVQFSAKGSGDSQALRYAVSGLTNPTTLAPAQWMRSVSGTVSIGVRQGNGAAGIEYFDVGEDWTRIETTVGSNASTTFNFDIERASTETASAEILLWNSQLEAKDFATSDIISPTNTSTVRATEQFYTTPSQAGIPTDGSAFTICGIRRLAPKRRVSNYQGLVTISDGTPTNRIIIERDGFFANSIRAVVIIGGVAEPALTFTASSGSLDLAIVKFAFTCQAGNFECTVQADGVNFGDGVGAPTTVTQASGTIPSGLTTYTFGNGYNFTTPLDGVVVRDWVYDVALDLPTKETLVA